MPVTRESWDLEEDGIFYPSGESYKDDYGWTVYKGEWQVYNVVMDAELSVEEDEDGVWEHWDIAPVTPLKYSIIDEESEINTLKEQIKEGELDDWSSGLLSFLIWAHNTTAEDVAKDILDKYFTKEEREAIKRFLRETYNITY